jgi:hypothetical protein
VWKLAATQQASTQCGASTFTNTIVSCVDRATGNWGYTTDVASDYKSYGASGWPAQWASAAEQFACDGWGTNSGRVGISCYAPSTRRFCVIELTHNSSWACQVKL